MITNSCVTTVDTDLDGVGDNADAFPNDATETVDSDHDGIGDNSDAFPNDPTESIDSDSDGVGDNSDAFPADGTESKDSDFDGVGDNTDAFPNDRQNTRLIAIDNSNGWSTSHAIFTTTSAVSDAPPSGVQISNGLVDFALTSGNVGTTAVITITYPAAIDPALLWWKFGPTASNNTPHWHVFEGAVISDNTVTLTITDGGDGDDDLLANGSISDPGGLGNAQPTTIVINGGSGGGGALNIWMLCVLFGMYLLRAEYTRRYSLHNK